MVPAATSLDSLLAARTLWHAGRSAATAADGEPTGHAGLDALLPQGGWPRRALTELLLPADGVGELSLLLPTLARCTRAGERVAVIAPPYLPYAPAWQAAGVDLSQLRIVEAAPRDALWAFEQCLRSGACAAVLGWPQQADARALRRLQVAADSGQCLGFVLRDRRHAANPSPAALRLEAVRDARGIAWQVRKCRGGPVPARPFVPEAVPALADSPAPSPARGGGLGWGPASHPAAARASGAPPSAFGTFPRKRGKEQPGAFPDERGKEQSGTFPNEQEKEQPGAFPRERRKEQSGAFPGERRKEPLEILPSAGRILAFSPAGNGAAASFASSGAPLTGDGTAPSPARGGGLGWGQAGDATAARASGAPPSAFGTFPRERGKEQPGAFLRERGKAQPGAFLREQGKAQPGAFPCGLGKAQSGAFPREQGKEQRMAVAVHAPAGAQQELQFVQAPASPARD